MHVSRRNIGHRQTSLFLVFNNLAGFGARTENPRVGGSIPPLATIRIKFLNQGVASERMDSLSKYERRCPIFRSAVHLTNTNCKGRPGPSCCGQEPSCRGPNCLLRSSRPRVANSCSELVDLAEPGPSYIRSRPARMSHAAWASMAARILPRHCASMPKASPYTTILITAPTPS
jgi:hypothetical protein